jgi:twitching motility protein PilT
VTQTFDQSLMSLVRQNIITYEEAHRQATNPDDFALRFSGISATSDARWDDFEGGAQDGNSAPGSVAFTQRGSPSAAPPSAPAPAARPATGGPATALGRINPTAPRPGAAPAQKPAAGQRLPAADDDFHIERF